MHKWNCKNSPKIQVLKCNVFCILFHDYSVSCYQYFYVSQIRWVKQAERCFKTMQISGKKNNMMEVRKNIPEMHVSGTEQKEHAHAKCSLRNLSKM